MTENAAVARETSAVRAFLSALAPPLTAGVLLASSIVLFGLRGPLVALILNVFLLFEVAGFSQSYALPMPARYFRLRRIEQPWLYEGLGIKVFQRLMRSPLYRRINPGFRLSGGRNGLAELRQSMLCAEAAHAVAFVVVSTFAVGALLLQWFDAAAWLTMFNVLLNGYPVMLQRYNRIRLDTLASRGHSRRPREIRA